MWSKKRRGNRCDLKKDQLQQVNYNVYHSVSKVCASLILLRGYLSMGCMSYGLDRRVDTTGCPAPHEGGLGGKLEVALHDRRYLFATGKNDLGQSSIIRSIFFFF